MPLGQVPPPEASKSIGEKSAMDGNMFKVKAFGVRDLMLPNLDGMNLFAEIDVFGKP